MTLSTDFKNFENVEVVRVVSPESLSVELGSTMRRLLTDWLLSLPSKHVELASESDRTATPAS